MERQFAIEQVGVSTKARRGDLKWTWCLVNLHSLLLVLLALVYSEFNNKLVMYVVRNTKITLISKAYTHE